MIQNIELLLLILADTLQRRIIQHCTALGMELFNSKLTPSDPPLNVPPIRILWCSIGDGVPNHIVSLLKCTQGNFCNIFVFKIRCKKGGIIASALSLSCKLCKILCPIFVRVEYGLHFFRILHLVENFTSTSCKDQKKACTHAARTHAHTHTKKHLLSSK